MTSGEALGRPDGPEETTCLIALGSNLGDRLAHLRAGLRMLQERPGIRITAASSLYETAPVGGPDRQGPYYNAAARLRTVMSAPDLLACLHEVEAVRARERLVRWGARTLDLDLLMYGDLVSMRDELLLPHPHMHERRFVMVPVCEVAPGFHHPLSGRTMRDLLADLEPQPGDLVQIATGWADDLIKEEIQ